MTIKYLKVALPFICVMLISSCGFTKIKTNGSEIGTIAGLSVTKEEVQREMRKHRSEVFVAVAKKNRINNSGSTFWETEKVDGVKAIDILRQRAVTSLASIKVQEKLLRERNLWPYASYPEFLKDLKTTNEGRKKSVANAEVIYGPIEYNEQTFFDYRFANALIQLKYKLVDEKLITITEEDMQNQFQKMQKTVYQSEKNTLKEFRRQVRDAYIEDAYNALIHQYAKEAKQNLNVKQFNQITLNN